jgi:hypothetical protein
MFDTTSRVCKGAGMDFHPGPIVKQSGSRVGFYASLRKISMTGTSTFGF